MQTVNSFDIFDTLLARTVQNPTDIFDIVEEKFPYSNFKSLRLTAQNNSNNTMDDIYYNLKLLTSESDETIHRLREFELKTEMENTIPIMSNISKIKNGDIFVSDMYLSHAEIIRLLNYHSINPNITLYVSVGGKANGEMWNYLTKQYSIVSHTGDNMHSDIVMASQYGIKGCYTEAHKFSTLEKILLHNAQIGLASFLRRFRLMNTYVEGSLEYKIYDQQVQYNIPLLLFMCRKLVNILESENRNTVLFLSRDGCLIYKLFSFLCPKYKSVYLLSSRIMNNNYNEEYKNYVMQNYNETDCILFDLHGSFNSGRELFGVLPRIFIFDLSKIENVYDKMTYISNKGDKGNRIELFNQDLNGSLLDLKNENPIRMPPETSLKHIKIMHDTIEQFIAYIGENAHILYHELFNADSFWLEYYAKIVCESEIICNNALVHDERTLTFLANKYNSDKGDIYKCAHHYTIKYQEIVSDVFRHKAGNNLLDNVHLLEIGLNRDDANSIPSLMMWNDYFNKNITLTGLDINPNFLRFNSSYDNIEIRIGDQSKEEDLQQLKTKTYDIIIDDGYHASKHQQISFKTLWSSVKSGGYYIIEDLHYQPESETCVKTKYLLEQWRNGNWIESEYINNDEIEKMKVEIENIGFYDSQSKLWGDKVVNALAYIKKI